MKELKISKEISLPIRAVTETFSAEELAIQAGLEPTSGTFSTYLSILSSNGLIERRGDVIRLNPDLLEV